HRDFKPENVLVADDGRVSVTDFGLVGLAGTAPTPAPYATDEPDEAVTITGSSALLGTPAYMSPEQHACTPVDERADQFAFCVALYEALYGEGPFAGEDDEELRKNVLLGNVRPEPRKAAVPSRLRRLLIRGLAVRREDRYPSMDALLAELARDPGKT